MSDKDDGNKIKDALLNDGVVAFVTDTVWGLGCDIKSKKAAEKIYKIKHRDKKKPLILMSDEIYPLLKYVKPLSKTAHQLIKTYFPGALTLVLPKSNLTPDYITSGMNTVGIRIPNNPIFADICRCIPSRVMATTSANLSFNPPALTYEETWNCFKHDVDYIAKDCGFCAKGTASTVVEVFEGGIKILRQGNVKIREIFD